MEAKLESMTFGIANAHKHRSGIYQLKSRHNGKFYIGSAVSFYNRLHTHSHHLREETHFNDHLISHKNKYGIEDLVMEVLEFVDDPDNNLIRREQWWLDNTDCLNREVGFNKCPIAQSQLNREMPDIHRQKTGQRSIGNKYSVGRKVSDETKLKISKIQGLPIARYNWDGKFMRIYESPMLLKKAGNCTNSVRQACKGLLNYKKSLWRVVLPDQEIRDLTPEEIKNPIFKVKKKRINHFSGDQLVGSYPTVKDAARFTGIPHHKIRTLCSGERKPFNGVDFKYEFYYE